ncbi:hypothetical protein PSS2_gp050 [Cyanophage PSS2]|uniref:hypothetical protein n=1 Tax=Cyanophage PSS2 TaxID=658401 RepID=UPI0001B04007|nr:hypothetical protein PSS2_gp050 [Cyanophage PSS2]ACT65612.1 hypothetical protein [Cyanophage PSS2]
MSTGYDEDRSAQELLDRIQEQYTPENMKLGPWKHNPKVRRWLAEQMLANAVRMLDGTCTLGWVRDSYGRSYERYVIEFNKDENFGVKEE